MKKLFSILFCCIIALQAYAQIDFNNYQPLKSAGTIPEDFRKLSQIKYQEDVKKEAKTSGHYVDQSKQQFLLKTNYLIDELLLSGKVLFGDTVTAYVNRVADRVLVNDQELRNKLRFYCLRSEEANAFSTNQGIVFITIGLIAQLENEAQLAFIISHEVAHYEKRHTLNSYLENERIFSDQTRYKYNTYDDKIRMASSYSKELELEADSLGLIRLSKTGYDCSESIGSMFVLQFSELPFEDLEFNADFLQNPVMQLPKDLFLDSIQPVNLERDQDDDSYSTHPNLATRRKRLDIILDEQKNCGIAKFAESKEEFESIRKICRFDVIYYDLCKRNYCSAFYNAYSLHQLDSTNLYLEKAMGKALYGMAKYKNDGNYSDVGKYYGKVEGQQQQCYHLFYQMNGPQLNMIALRYLYDLSAKDSSAFICSLRDDLAEEAIRVNEIHFTDMKKTTDLYYELKKAASDTVVKKDSVVAPVAVKSTGDDKGYVSKYDKLRQEKKKKEQNQVVETKKADASKFYLLAFSDILNQPGVAAMFDRAEKKSEERKAAEQAEKARIEKMSPYEYRKMKQDEKNNVRKTGLSLGIDTVVFVDPFYFEADDRHGLKLINSETQLLKFSEQIAENAKYAQLNIQVLNPKTFGAGDVDLYNDLAMINDWMGERLDHDDMEIIPLQAENIATVAKKYNTTHFCYTGVFSYKQRRDNVLGILLYSIIIYPLLPFGIVYACTPEHHTYYYTFMYDVNTGKQDINQTIHLKSKSKNGFINSIMYDTMLQIKSKKTDKKQKR